jgi:hypothetical protein
MHLVFDLDKGRFGVCSSPFRDVRQDLGALLLPGVFIHPCYLLLLLENGAILPASLLCGYGLCKKVRRTHRFPDNRDRLPAASISEPAASVAQLLDTCTLARVYRDRACVGY